MTTLNMDPLDVEGVFTPKAPAEGEVPKLLARPLPEEITPPKSLERPEEVTLSQPQTTIQQPAPVGMQDLGGTGVTDQQVKDTTDADRTAAYINKAAQLENQSIQVADAAQVISQEMGANAAELTNMQREMDTQYKKSLERADEYQKDLSGLKNQMSEANRDISETVIDPKRMFKDMNTGNKVMLAIAIGLSGLGSGTNQSLEQLNKLIDKDISAQKTNADNMKQSAKDKQKYALDMFKLKYPENPEAAARLYYANKIKAMVSAQAARTKSKEAQLNAEVLKSGLEGQASDALLQLTKDRRKEYLDQMANKNKKTSLKHEGKMRIEKLNAASIYLHKIIDIYKNNKLGTRLNPNLRGKLDALKSEFVMAKVMGRSGAAFTESEVKTAEKQVNGWVSQLSEFWELGHKARVSHLIKTEVKDLDDSMKIHTGDDYELIPSNSVRNDWVKRKKNMIDMSMYKD